MIQYDQPFVHIACNRGQFLPSAVQFPHLRAELLLLLLQPPQQRRKLLIYIVRKRLLQIHAVYGLNYTFDLRPAYYYCRQKHKGDYQHNVWDAAQESRKAALSALSHPYNAAILQPHGIIISLNAQSGRKPGGFPFPVCKGFLDFLAFHMVFHILRLGLAVVKHFAVLRYMSHSPSAGCG